MSRTDKDRPWWVATEEWEPWHEDCPYGVSKWGQWRYSHDCNLPPAPVKTNWATAPRKGRHGSCHWEPVWPKEDRYWGAGPVPKWFRDWDWLRPDRQRARMAMEKAKKEYRGSAEVDVEPPTEQHRHSAGWRYW